MNERMGRDGQTTTTQKVRCRNRKQLEAEEKARQVQQLQSWRRAEPLALDTWKRLSSEELRSSGGNVHRLAGLIQLRYQTSREDSDRQVAAFMTAHVAPA